MKTGNLNIKIDYKPLSTNKVVSLLGGSYRQTYNADTSQFEPNRRIDPCIVNVSCNVTDLHGLVNGNVNSSLVDVVWKQITEEGEYVVIKDDDRDFKIGKADEKGKLTILKNVSDVESLIIVFTARYIEPKTKRICNFQESFTMITTATAKAPILVETSAPAGYTLYPTENNVGLVCQANLAQGKDKVPAAYYWYKGGVEITDTNGFTGSKTERLFIPASQISKEGNPISVEIINCSDVLKEMISKDPSVTSLPKDYRPHSKEGKIYKADFMLKKELPVYQASVLYPDVVSPDADSVQVEMILTTNNGVIENPEKLFSVGWLKQPNGTFKYKGFKIKIPMSEVKTMYESNVQLDYELREDLTLK